jgi:hypothetical protein
MVDDQSRPSISSALPQHPLPIALPTDWPDWIDTPLFEHELTQLLICLNRQIPLAQPIGLLSSRELPSWTEHFAPEADPINFQKSSLSIFSQACTSMTYAHAYTFSGRSKKGWCDMCGAKVYGYCLSESRSLLESYSDALQ